MQRCEPFILIVFALTAHVFAGLQLAFNEQWGNKTKTAFTSARSYFPVQVALSLILMQSDLPILSD
jgi:succinate dehydrogenase/fumarate reductase cytochrome b subunit